MKPLRASLLFLFFFIFFTDFSHATVISVKTANGKVVSAANQVLVRRKNWQPKSTQNELGQIGVQVLPVPVNETMESFLKKLESDPEVEFAEPNVMVRALAVAPNDSFFGTQYYLGTSLSTTPVANDHLNILPAWDIESGDPSVVIAILDTGVTLTHPDLNDNLWSDPNDSNVHGATMRMEINNDGDCTDTGEMCFNTTPNDDFAGTYHGTRVAGLAAAETGNAADMAGVCRGCRIMAVKVLNSAGSGTSESVAAGILYAVNNGAKVINMSLGSDVGTQTEKAAVDYAVSRNVVVVAASGNDGPPQCRINFPAAYDSVISVGATDVTDTLANFSCSIGALDVVAPGKTMVTISTVSGSSLSGDGTSFAAPLVAGLAGLVLSLNPSLTPAEVNRHINFNADDLGAARYDGVYGFGRINALRTLLAVQNGTTYASNPGFPGETFPEPNPYRPLTDNAVKIRVPSGLAAATDKKIVIRNISGEEVKTIQCGAECSWDGKSDDGGHVASGLYFYRVESSLGNVKGKITVIK